MQWISINEDKLPEENHVLLFDKNEGICVGYRRFGRYNHHPVGDFATGTPLFNVTHWMPLPLPPKDID